MPSFLSRPGTFLTADATPSLVANTPTTGQTYTVATGQDEVYFNHSATLAALTVVLPSGAVNGDSLELKFRGAVTTLTIQPFTLGAPTSATAGQVQRYRYLTGWIYW